MKSSEVQILRIHLDSDEKYGVETLYESLVFAAKRFGLRHAVVHKGSMGFKGEDEIAYRQLWRITERMPVIVEIIDSTEKILEFQETIKPFFTGTRKEPLITKSKGEGLFFKPSGKKSI